MEAKFAQRPLVYNKLFSTVETLTVRREGNANANDNTNALLRSGGVTLVAVGTSLVLQSMGNIKLKISSLANLLFIIESSLRG